jgi:hypothetical protein
VSSIFLNFREKNVKKGDDPNGTGPPERPDVYRETTRGATLGNFATPTRKGTEEILGGFLIVNQ